MYAQVEKSKENSSPAGRRENRAVANSVAQKKSNGKQGFGFVDNRPNARENIIRQCIMNRGELKQFKLKDNCRPEHVFGDWRIDISTRYPDKVMRSLKKYAFENKKMSDESQTIEEELKQSTYLSPSEINDNSRGQALEQQKVLLKSELNIFYKAIRDSNIIESTVDKGTKGLIGAVNYAKKIDSMFGRQKSEYDVKWRLKANMSEIVIRETATRIEALLGLANEELVIPKNLNVSLRRHYWKTLSEDSDSKTQNSIMGPMVGINDVKQDVNEIANKYKDKYFRGTLSDFALTTTGGRAYWIDKVNNEQPHTFPTHGTGTASFTFDEYNKAKYIKCRLPNLLRSSKSDYKKAGKEGKKRIIGARQEIEILKKDSIFNSTKTKLRNIGVKNIGI